MLKILREIEAFKTLVVSQINHCQATVDAPDKPKGECFIDIICGDWDTVISYEPDIGFGFFDDDQIGLWEKPRLVIVDASEAAAHFIKLEKAYRSRTGNTVEPSEFSGGRQAFEGNHPPAVTACEQPV